MSLTPTSGLSVSWRAPGEPIIQTRPEHRSSLVHFPRSGDGGGKPREQLVTPKPGLQVSPDSVPVAKSLWFSYGCLRDLHRRRHCRLLLSPFGSATARLQLVCSGTENESSRCGRRGLSGSSLIQSGFSRRLRAHISFSWYYLHCITYALVAFTLRATLRLVPGEQ